MKVVIASAKRTPIGPFNVSLPSFSAPKLGSIAIKWVLSESNIDPSIVNEVIMGNVLTAGLGQAPGRQAAHYMQAFRLLNQTITYDLWDDYNNIIFVFVLKRMQRNIEASYRSKLSTHK